MSEEAKTEVPKSDEKLLFTVSMADGKLKITGNLTSYTLLLTLLQASEIVRTQVLLESVQQSQKNAISESVITGK